MSLKINIDFQVIPTFDPKTILVVDTSNWAHITEKPSIIEITLPGESDVITHYFDKNKINILNSNNLYSTCHTCEEQPLIDLPDGIYTITVKGSPDKFNLTRQYLKTDVTRLKVDTFISTLNLNCDNISSDLINRIQRINLFLEAAESNTRLGNFFEAQQLLFKAQKYTTKLKGCKTCV